MNENEEKLSDTTSEILLNSFKDPQLVDIESFKSLRDNVDDSFSEQELEIISNALSILITQINEGMTIIYYKGKLRDIDLYVLYKYFMRYKYLVEYTGCSLSLINYSDISRSCGLYEYTFNVSIME
jgi:hypothetical protein